jgi:hypothetical protein
VIHNIEKATMIRKLLWQLNTDATPGDYYEFGVAQGNSIRAAELAIRKSKYPKLGIRGLSRNIYGFDNFTGFSSLSIIDSHPTWNGEKYNHSLAKVKKRFRKIKNVNLIQTDVCNMLDSGDILTNGSQWGIPFDSEASLVLFDLDLYAPTKSALNWIKPKLKQGTFLMFDELFYFAARNDRGELRAFLEFQNENPKLQFTKIASYGAGGQVFVVSKL